MNSCNIIEMSSTKEIDNIRKGCNSDAEFSGKLHCFIKTLKDNLNSTVVKMKNYLILLSQPE